MARRISARSISAIVGAREVERRVRSVSTSSAKAARLTVMRLDGTIVGRYGRPGRGLNQFYQPWDLTVLSDGRILVADTGNHRLVELTP